MKIKSVNHPQEGWNWAVFCCLLINMATPNKCTTQLNSAEYGSKCIINSSLRTNCWLENQIRRFRHLADI